MMRRRPRPPLWPYPPLRRYQRWQHYGLRGGGARERDADGHDRGQQHGANQSNADHILARSAAEFCQAPAFAGAFGLALRGWMVPPPRLLLFTGSEPL